MPASDWTQVGRTELMAMAERLEAALKQALEELSSVRRSRDTYLESLSHVQERCATLVLENRRLRAAIAILEADNPKDE